MCHMTADTTEELLEMVDKIGVQRKWLQHPGEWKEHFDISLGKKALAIQHGAIAIEWGDCPATKRRLDVFIAENQAKRAH